jgi:hypothetical protein
MTASRIAIPLGRIVDSQQAVIAVRVDGLIIEPIGQRHVELPI